MRTLDRYPGKKKPPQAKEILQDLPRNPKDRGRMIQVRRGQAKLKVQQTEQARNEAIRKRQAAKPEDKWITVPLVSGKHIHAGGKRRDLLACFIGNINIHPIRQKIQQAMRHHDNVIVKRGSNSSSANVSEFVTLMQRSVFALCPRGFGTTSFRLTEAMDFGCIPVYISNTFSIPFEKILDIKDVCIIVKEDQIHGLHKKLQNIPQDHIDRYRENIAKYKDKHFSLEGCCRTILFDHIEKDQHLD